MAFPQYDEKLVTSVRQTLVESASGKSPVKFASLIQTLENNVATRAKMYVNFQETFTFYETNQDFFPLGLFFLTFLAITQFQLAFLISTK